MSGVDGLGALDSVLQDLENLTIWAKVDAPTVVGKATLELIDGQFEKRSDPNNGAKWTKRMPPPGSHPILELTKRMREGFSVKSVRRTKVTIGQKWFYWFFHQFGTKFMVPRRFVPLTSKPLPTAWVKKYSEDLQESLSELRIFR